MKAHRCGQVHTHVRLTALDSLVSSQTRASWHYGNLVRVSCTNIKYDPKVADKYFGGKKVL